MNCLGICLAIEGPLPKSGLVVSNHLGYLDIVLYAAAIPCCFVSKNEVGYWPIFGSLARAGATVFIDRTKSASANATAVELARRLSLHVLVLLFPEGTSTDGTEVARFHPRLFRPAIEQQAPITEAAICYRPDGCAEERDICWHGDAAFIPHLWKVMGIRRVCARIRFNQPQIYQDARTAAQTAQANIENMRTRIRLQDDWPSPDTGPDRALASLGGHLLAAVCKRCLQRHLLGLEGHEESIDKIAGEKPCAHETECVEIG
jgi:lyso-ornithine lipid O-acyltransferase